MTPKFRKIMLTTVTNEMNRVYNLFIDRNPNFLKIGGKVSLYGHSLGSLLALTFCAINHQLLVHLAKSSNVQKKTKTTLDFEVENLYAVGSPIGLFLLLRGLKIASREYYNAIRKVYQLKNWSDISLGNESDDVRNSDEHLKDGKDNEKLENEGNDDKKDLNEENEQNKKMSRKDLSIGNKDAEDPMMLMQDSVTLIPLCYPACRSVYNIFHKADPIAFRIEPLVARHYSKTLKPALVLYHKGGLKAMQLGFQEFGSNISKTTSNILRSLSLSKPPDESANKRKNNKQAREKHFIERELLKRKQLQKLYSEAGTVYQVKTSSSPVVNEDGQLDYKTNGEAKLKSLNKSGRIDYCLQQGILDVGYISAITDHLNYWTDGDASYFILRETYKNYDDD
ncbi:DDHD domain-containing protein [Gigaspora rosea]|uniref:DDHD domain-containing protein n=1 Tax=Gigaspora rosea TaxID=44941 RepID=A0A397UFQ3_9GLOM|nr:DDHD domain-containing protein [Gigaspora rosea]